MHFNAYQIATIVRCVPDFPIIVVVSELQTVVNFYIYKCDING